MTSLVLIMIGGAIGALLRYAVSGLTYRFLNSGFPWGTLAVNLTGSLLIGFLWETFDRMAVSPSMRAFTLVGILGAFTTFSTFSLENLNLLRTGEVRYAVTNIILSNGLGLICVFLGFMASRYFTGLFR